MALHRECKAMQAVLIAALPYEPISQITLLETGDKTCLDSLACSAPPQF
jgi:hypothetical protein